MSSQLTAWTSPSTLNNYNTRQDKQNNYSWMLDNRQHRTVNPERNETNYLSPLTAQALCSEALSRPQPEREN